MDVIPMMIKILNMLLPTTLLIAMSAFLLRAAVILTAASGALVPNATIVKPMTSCGIWNLSAIFDDPSTNLSAPLISSTNPKARRSN